MAAGIFNPSRYITAGHSRVANAGGVQKVFGEGLPPRLHSSRNPRRGSPVPNIDHGLPVWASRNWDKGLTLFSGLGTYDSQLDFLASLDVGGLHWFDGLPLSTPRNV